MKIIEEHQVSTVGEKMYKQHNAITSGRYDFTACQLDIVFMVLASLQEGELSYKIHTSDIELITGRKWNISQLTNSTEQLLTRMFEVETEDRYRQFVLFQYFDYIKGTRTIEVRLSEVALPYFFDLKNNFTHFQLKSVLGCTSSYAKRLYMIACQWKSVGRFPKPIKIIELKKMLGLIDKKGNEQYSEITGFKKKVLDIAKKQINENTDLSFDYELIKKGRSFEYIQIYVNISKFNPEQLSIDFKKPIVEQKDIRKIMAYGFTEKQATEIAENIKIPEFEAIIFDLNKSAREGKIKVTNAIAYLTGVFKKKGYLKE